MYSIETEFLTLRGWKLYTELEDSDILAFEEDGQFNWLSQVDAGLKYYDFKLKLLRCQIGRSGKFCVESTDPIRVFRKSKKGHWEKNYYTLSDVIYKLEKVEYISGHVVGTMDSPAFPLENDTLAVFLASCFRRIHEIAADGTIYFKLSRGLGKQQVIDFLLKHKIPTESIGMANNNMLVSVKIATLPELFACIYGRPDLFCKVIQEMLSYGPVGGKRSIKIIRFYCPHLVDMAQLSVFLTGHNSKVIFDEVTKRKDYALIVEPTSRSISFRNRTFIVSEEVEGVVVREPHAITRYRGRISIL